jgi:hypothetical protein
MLPPTFQVSGLDDDVLLSEFKALQMLALYNGPAGAEDSTFEDDITSAKQDKKCKHVDEGLEEFLLQQVGTHEAGASAASAGACAGLGLAAHGLLFGSKSSWAWLQNVREVTGAWRMGTIACLKQQAMQLQAGGCV